MLLLHAWGFAIRLTVPSRPRVLNSYGFALIREISTLKQLQRDVRDHNKTALPYLTAVREVVSERHSAIAALVAQVEKPN